MICYFCKLDKEKNQFYRNKSKSSGYGNRCKSCELIRDREKRLNRREKVFKHYGSICMCCKQKDIRFLSIDHTNDDGAKQRRSIRKTSGDPFYKWIIKNNYPKYLQTLCFNCNMAKHIYGQCPHNLSKKT